MNPKFKIHCFIRKKKRELCDKLYELGYSIMFSARFGYGTCLYANYGHAYGGDGDDHLSTIIDCGENEALFLALAALRDDSDYMQWFCDDEMEEGKSFFLCEYDDVEKHIHEKMDGWDCEGFHKATAEELIEHFKNK